MLVHMLFVIYIFSREIELVKSTDELKFWNPNPKYNARRTVANSNQVNHPNSKPQLRSSKVKNRAQDQKTTMGKLETEKLKPIPNLRSRTKGVDNSPEETTKWPKIQQHRYKMKGRKEAVRSTRMTPLYMMQQSEEKGHTVSTNAHVTKPKEDEEVEALSPYGIKQQMINLVKEFPAANITVEVIGRTVEYNDIIMMKVTERNSEINRYFRADDSKYVDEVPEKKVIFIVHGLSVMGITRVPCLVSNPQFKTLLSFYFSYLDKFDIFLIPMANPDGFVISRRLAAASSGVWNKNLSPQGACPGVSLDRNFDVAWNSTPSTHNYRFIKEPNSCSQNFPGVNPFSEPETKAIKEVFHHFSHKMCAYIHVHSGSYEYESFKGDAVLYPRGYTEAQIDDDKYIDLRADLDEAMKNASFQVLGVAVETLHNWYGQVSGTSVDYASTVYGIPYAMEFVMQPYQDFAKAKQSFSLYALNELWKRAIDVVFNNIFRNTRKDE